MWYGNEWDECNRLFIDTPNSTIVNNTLTIPIGMNPALCGWVGRPFFFLITFLYQIVFCTRFSLDLQLTKFTQKKCRTDLEIVG